MNQLLEYWDAFRAWVKTTINHIEESPQFERLVLKFEGLEPRQQKWVRIGSILFGIFLITLVYCYPILSLALRKGELDDTRALIRSVQAFNDENAVVRRPAPRPEGWKSTLQASNPKEFEAALSQYAESIGIPVDFVILTPVNGNVYQVEIQELSLRQAVTLLFQVDGYHPALRFDDLKIAVHPDSKDLLTLRAKVRFLQELGLEGPPPDFDSAANGDDDDPVDAPVTGGRGNGYPSASAGPGGTSLPPPPTGAYPPPPSGIPGDDFDSDLPPPSLNFEDDM